MATGARAASIDQVEVLQLFAGQVERAEIVEWADGGIKAVRQERLGAIVLREGGLRDPDPQLVTQAVIRMLQRDGLQLLGWSEGAQGLRARLAFLHRLGVTGTVQGEWPEVSDVALLASLDQWLAPALGPVRRTADLERLDVTSLLLDRLGWEQRRALDQLAPTHLTVPSGSRIALDYRDPAVPVLAVKLQEVFGLQATPRIGGGTVPVTLHLLSPARRPVQVTQDLAGFWRTSYFDVRKEMKGRYPRHIWPEDPSQAVPTARTRKK
jgi:ATP-dependent helicase HrpB